MVQAILCRIAAGEQLAFAELIDRYQRQLFGFLGRFGMSQAQAEDIAQETFLRAWTHLHSYQPERAQFVTWLFTIARNLAYDALQKQPHQHAMLDVVIPDELPDPSQIMERNQQHSRLHSALRQLPISDRSALALVYVHELGLADAARIENVSLAAIKTRLYRAKQRLRAILELDNESETANER